MNELARSSQTGQVIEFSKRLPAKSGGLIGVLPGKLEIAVGSPPFDAAGNSVRAQRAIAAIQKGPSGQSVGQRHASGGRNV